MQPKSPPVTATRKWFDEVFDLCIGDIEDICKAAGNAGVSVGVIHRGHQRTYHLGYRDVKKQLPPNDDTLYCIGSLTKAMTATALGLLVEDHIPLKTKDGQEFFNWKTKISDLFPELKSAANPIIAGEATIRDFLSHHTGLAGMDNLWQGIHNRVTIDKYEAVQAFNSLLRADSFRDSFVYNNLQYSIAGNIIEKLSKEAVWGDFLKKRVLKPLGMARTTPSLRDLQRDDNVAEPYVILLDGKPCKIEQPTINDGTLIGSAGGVRSSIRDMLKWGAAFLDAQNPDPARPPNIVPHILSEVFSAISIVKPDPTDEQLYGMGWYCQQLPSRLGPWSENLLIAPGTVHVMPTYSYTHGHEHYHVFSHGGLIAGFTTSFYILPNPGTVVVVLSNSNALGDAVDRIAHVLLQGLLQTRPRIDFVSEAKKTAEYRRRWFPTYFRDPWEKNRGLNTKIPLPLDEYIGEYKLTTFPFTFRIARTDLVDDRGKQLLTVTFNNTESQVHQLEHYESNKWSFLPRTYDEYIKIGYLAWEHWKDFLIDFRGNQEGKIDGAVLTSEARPLLFEKTSEKVFSTSADCYSEPSIRH